MTRSDAARRILEHIAHTSSPLVLITASYGSALSSLLRSPEGETTTRFEPLPATVMDGALLERRLTTLQKKDPVTPHQAARRIINSTTNPPPATHTRRILTINNVELLDADSRAVVDLLIRDDRIGLIMTSSSPSRLGFRYGRWLQSERALTIDLPEPTSGEVHERITELLGYPPTETLTEYLRRVTRSAPQGIELMLRAAVGSDLITTVGARSTLARSPTWTDRRAAADVIDVLEHDLGENAVKLLQRVALAEDPPLRDFTGDDETRDAIFWMIEAGLLTVHTGSVQVPRHHLRRSLVLSPGCTRTHDEPTPSLELHRRSNGRALELETGCATAHELLNQGLLHQAHLLLGGLPPTDPGVRYLTASIKVVAGAPRSALELLDEGLREGIDSADIRALRAFVAGALLGSPLAEDNGLGDISARLHSFSDYDPSRYLATFSPPAEAGTISETADKNGHLLKVDTLSQTTAAVLDAYAAALNCDYERADASLRLAAQVPLHHLPITATGWIAERFVATRIIACPGEHLLPKRWTETTTPEQWLLHSINEQTVQIFSDLVCGADSLDLRHRLDDLWAQFEGRLPTGPTVSRRLLESLDFAAGGERSARLLGPPGLVPVGLTGTLRYASSDTMTVIGRLLTTSEESLEEVITRAFQIYSAVPGVLRLILRCVLLRRSTQLSTRALTMVLGHARAAGVEEGVLSAAGELRTDTESRRQILNRPLPDHPEFRFCSTPTSIRASAKGTMSAETSQLLTKREREVALQLMAGTATEAVAHRLGISPRTVQTHVRNIYRKLGVGSRTQLRARASVTQPAGRDGR